MNVSTLKTVMPASVQDADDQSCGQILSFEESAVVARWFYGPDAPPDPEYDPRRPARETILRWAARHGLVLYKGAPAAKHPLKYHPRDKDCPEPNNEGKCRCFIPWDGKGTVLIRVPQHMVVLDEDGPAAAAVTASLQLPPHFAIRSRKSGGIKRFGFLPGGMRRAIKIRPDLDVLGNPGSKAIWCKIWDDEAGYDIISDSDNIPLYPPSMAGLYQDRTSVRSVRPKGERAKCATFLGGLPSTEELLGEGIPRGVQDDALWKLACRLAGQGKNEEQILLLLLTAVTHSEQDERNPWRPGQLRDKAARAVAFIESQGGARLRGGQAESAGGCPEYPILTSRSQVLTLRRYLGLLQDLCEREVRKERERIIRAQTTRALERLLEKVRTAEASGWFRGIRGDWARRAFELFTTLISRAIEEGSQTVSWTRQQVASAAGRPYSTVCRDLAKLAHHGLIDLAFGKIRLVLSASPVRKSRRDLPESISTEEAMDVVARMLPAEGQKPRKVSQADMVKEANFVARETRRRATVYRIRQALKELVDHGRATKIIPAKPQKVGKKLDARGRLVDKWESEPSTWAYGRVPVPEQPKKPGRSRIERAFRDMADCDHCTVDEMESQWLAAA